MLGVALAITLVGTAIVEVTHAHAGRSEQPLSCALCVVVQQSVEVGDAVALPAPDLSHPVESNIAVPSTPLCRRPVHPRLSRAPPA